MEGCRRARILIVLSLRGGTHQAILVVLLNAGSRNYWLLGPHPDRNQVSFHDSGLSSSAFITLHLLRRPENTISTNARPQPYILNRVFAQASQQHPGLNHGRMWACTCTYGAFRPRRAPPEPVVSGKQHESARAPCICSGEQATSWPDSWKDAGVHAYLWCFPFGVGPTRQFWWCS